MRYGDTPQGRRQIEGLVHELRATAKERVTAEQEAMVTTEAGRAICALDWMDDVTCADVAEVERQAKVQALKHLRGELSDVHSQHEAPRHLSLAGCAACAVAWDLLTRR